MKTKLNKLFFVAIPLLLAAGTVLTGWVFRIEDKRMREDFMVGARILRSAIDPWRILRLKGSEADLVSPDYQRLKEQLSLARFSNPECRFTYLMGRRPDGQVFFFLDSEPPNSKDYSPPGQIYTEISRPMRDVFVTGKEVVAGPASDRWGRWVSAAVPIADPETGKIIAVLGVDIAARHWTALIVYHSLPPAVVTLLLFMIVGTFLSIQQRDKLEKMRLSASRMALQQSTENFQKLFENMADGMAIYRAVEEGRNFVFVNLNKTGEKISQVKRQDIIGKKITEVFPAAADIGLVEVLRRVWSSGVSEYLPGILYKDQRIEHWTENYILRLPSGLVVSIYSNIPKRRQVDEEIKSLAKFLDESPRPILRISVDGRLLFINRAGLDQLADWHLQIAQPAPLHLRDLAFKALETGSGQHADIAYGRQVYFFHVTPVSGSGYANLYGIDITERKKMEEELKRKTEFLEAQTEASLDGLLVVDENGQRSLTNKRLLELWQVPQAVATDKDDAALLQFAASKVKNPKEFLAQINYLYARRSETSKDEVEFKDGMIFERYSSPVIDKNGKYFGRIWTFRDITERKQAERKILEYTKRLGYLTKYANDLIILLDENFNLLEVNERAEDVYGYTRDELVGKHATFLRASEVREAFSRQIASVHEGGRVLFETVHMRKNEERFPVEISVNTFDADKKRFYLAVIRDITERKKAEEKLSRALAEEIKLREMTTSMLEDNKRISEKLENSLERLKEAQIQLVHAEKMEAIGRMASGIAHEVKNPLGIILQGINYLEGKLPSEEQGDRQILQMMKDSVKRADGIVRALLDFSRTEGLRQERQDINVVIEGSLELMRHRLKLQPVELVFHLERNLPKIFIDRGKIEQVFVNLFNNALDAMPQGGKLYVRSCLSEMKAPGDKVGNRKEDGFKAGEKVVVTEIEDTGVGIDEGIINKVFDPFFTTKDRTEGTGLGLSIAKSIIEMHNGLIRVESVRGKGTKFTILFRLFKEDRG
ncbi:MAG: PAS domain S-box protein [Candidatus Velamenicoccus archaeovorus]